jgi:1-acyl-sn-glycerol-3-phosphate acyltransferase
MHMLRWCAEVVVALPSPHTGGTNQTGSGWARTLLTRLEVDCKSSALHRKRGRCCWVANHISWVDILALHATCHCRFVAKADVKRWPLIGTLATGGGTLYVRRESRRDAMRMVHDMEQVLREGVILAVFPEGTTGDGDSVLPFHASLLQAAIAADAPVQAVAIRYVDARSGTPSQASVTRAISRS